VVGKPHALERQAAADLVNKLANFKLRVSKDGQFVEEGAGRNALRNPALCLAELAGAVIRQSGTASLSAGDLVSTGTLTSGHPIARGETWEVQVDSLQIDPLTLRLT
jgi:2-keto-4-pentenoate hydratase